MSPAPIVLAMVTSSVVSMVNEDRPSTSAGAMPGVAQRGHDGLGGQLALGPVDLLGELGLPDAHDGRGVRAAGWLCRPWTPETYPPGGEHHRQRERRAEGHPLDVRRLGLRVQA